MNSGYGYNYQYYPPANTPPPPPPKKKSKKWIPFTIIGAYKLFVIIAVICIIYFVVNTGYTTVSGSGVPTVFGKTYLSIQTDSMSPFLEPGDLAVGKADFEVEELRSGDVITYWTVIDGERVLNTHRIVNVYDGGGYLIFETKGDNNSTSDALTVHESEVVSVYQSSIPGGGESLDYLHTSQGFMILIIICLLAIIV